LGAFPFPVTDQKVVAAVHRFVAEHAGPG
jgi:hypothetical protein